MSGARSRIAEWFAAGIVQSVASVAFISFTGYITGAWPVILRFASRNPGEFALWTLLALVAGALLGSMWRNRANGKRIAELESEIASQTANGQSDDGRSEKKKSELLMVMDEAMKMSIRRLDIDAKAVLYLINVNGSATWKYPERYGEPDEVNDALEELEERGMVTFETCVDGRRWSLTGRCRRIVESEPGLLDEGRKRAIEFAAE